MRNKLTGALLLILTIYSHGFAQTKTAVAGKKESQAVGASISIRDVKNKPLIILNNKEITADSLKKIDSRQVESIEVLKDADGLSSYGAKGIAGVIIVSTKKGQPQEENFLLLGSREADSTQLSTRVIDLQNAKEPLYLMDGRIISRSEMNQLDPKDIAQVDVFKDASAIAKYGTDGINGVIKITTKNASQKSNK